MMRDYPGDDIFNALLALGYAIEVKTDGQIDAVRNQAHAYGTINDDGSITWKQGHQGLLQQARIQELQERAEHAKNVREQRPPRKVIYTQ